MRLDKDALCGDVQSAVQVRAFVWGEQSIGHKGAFHGRDVVLLRHQAAVFPARDRTAMKTAFDAGNQFTLARTDFV